MMQGSSAQILIVEDDAFTADTLERILLSEGYQVVGKAIGGREAIEKALSLVPDLVLMDILLADDVDGISAGREISQRINKPVVFISSLDDNETIEISRSVDPFGYIRKPCDKRELIIVIENALYRHQTEREQADSNQRLSLILDSVDEAILCCLADGSIDYLNPAAEKLLDCRLATVQGQKLDTVFSLANKEPLPRPDAFPATAVIRTTSGKEIQVSFRTTPLPEKNRLIFVIRDESERLRHEKLLSESERQFRQLVELSPEAIFVIDNNDIVFMNAAGKRLLDLPPASTPPQASRLFQGLTIQAEGPDWSQAVETTLILPAGGSVDTEVLATPIIFRGRPCTQLLCQNTTARKQRFESERQAHKMEALGRLAGGIAHDFNNILTAILGYCELAQSQAQTGASNQDELEQIRQVAERASGLTRQLLVFSRPQNLQYKLLDLVQIVNETEKLLRRLIGENITLSIKQSDRLSPILADASQVQQVIINLAVNAKDAMPEGGCLSIQTRTIMLDNKTEGIELVVSDTGHGMTEEVRRHLFEPFYTTKAPGQGTGLGLSSVYGTVTQAGGSIAVTSSPGAGTTFTIVFPAASPEALPQPEIQESIDVHGGRNERVLLIEDDPLVRSLASTFLKREGYVVLEADNGTSGLDLARAQKGRIDLLLTDMVLPEKSGETIAEEIRSLHPETQILYISGYGDIRIEDTPKHPRLLQKPFTGAELLRAVRQTLAPEAGSDG